MTLAKAQIPEGEYRLLRQRAVARGNPMKGIVREAIRASLQDEKADSDDPLFHAFPLDSSGKEGHRVARDHDDDLYGKTSRRDSSIRARGLPSGIITIETIFEPSKSAGGSHVGRRRNRSRPTS
jgi:hypothetical protein